MVKEPTTYLRLPADVRRMLRLAAAAADRTLSEHVADLVREDARKSGIALLATDKRKGGRR